MKQCVPDDQFFMFVRCISSLSFVYFCYEISLPPRMLEIIICRDRV